MQFTHEGIGLVMEREGMQEIAKSYREPIRPNLASRSALDAWESRRLQKIVT